MVSEEIREEQSVFHAPDTNIIPFSQYKVPNEYKQLKIKLLQMGLDPNECDMYILLLEKGSKKILEIASQIGFGRTHLYHIICGLQNKGLVTATFKHPIKFSSVRPEKALKILAKCKKKTPREKEEILAKNLAKLSGTIFATNKMQDNFIMLDLDQVYSKAKEMQINSKHEILILAHANDIDALYDCGFMNALQSQLEAGINAKILVSSERNSIDKLRSFGETVRYMEDAVLEPFSFIIVDNSQLIVIERSMYGGEKLRAIWTTFEPFISALYFLFSDLWESSSIS